MLTNATALMAHIRNIFICKRICVSTACRSRNQQFLQLILHLPGSHFFWPWKQTAEWEEQRWEPLHPQPQNHTGAIRPMTLITHFGPELDVPCYDQTLWQRRTQSKPPISTSEAGVLWGVDIWFIVFLKSLPLKWEFNVLSSCIQLGAAAQHNRVRNF